MRRLLPGLAACFASAWLCAPSSAGAAPGPTLTPERPLDAPLPANAPGDQFEAAIAYNGTVALLVWSDRRTADNTTHIFGARLDVTGALLDPTGFPIVLSAGQQSHPTVAAAGAEFFVAWADNRNLPIGHKSDIYGTRVTANGQVVTPGGFAVLDSASSEANPRLASSGNGLLLAYLDGDTRAPSAVRLAANGVMLGSILELSQSGCAGDVAVAFDGTSYVVSFSNAQTASMPKVFVQRVQLDGGTLDGKGLLATKAPDEATQDAPFIASSPAGHSLVGWRDSRGTGAAGSGLYASTVDGGTLGVVDLPVVPDAGTVALVRPTGHFDGTRFLMAWEHPPAIFGAVLLPDAGRGAATRLGAGDGGHSEPLLGSTSAETFVVFANGGGISSTSTDAKVSSDLWLRKLRVDPATSTLVGKGGSDLALLTRAANREEGLVLASDGTGFLAVWCDDRDPGGAGLYGVHLRPDGTAVEPEAFLVAAKVTCSGENPPALAGDGKRYLVVWQSGARLLGRRLGSIGAPDSGTFLIDAEASSLSQPALALDGDEAMVVFIRLGAAMSARPRVVAQRLGPEGPIGDGGAVIGADDWNNRETPAVAFSRGEYLVAWAESGGAVPYDVLGQRLDRQGSPIDGGALILAGGGPRQAKPALLAGADGGFVAAWEEASDATAASWVSGALVNGATVSGVARISAGNGRGPALVRDGARLYATWASDRSATAQILGVSLDEASLGLGQEEIVGSAPFPTGPSLAGSGGGAIAIGYSRFDAVPGVAAGRAYVRVRQSPLALGAVCTTNAACASEYCVDGVCCESLCGGGAPGDCQACGADGRCGVRPAGQLCRAEQGECDLADYCDGVAGSCTDLFRGDGGSCSPVIRSRYAWSCGCAGVEGGPAGLGLLVALLVRGRRGRGAGGSR